MFNSIKMKAIFISLLCVFSTAHATEEKVLNVYNWSDYIAPDTISNFEKETGIKVNYTTFDSNETLHKKLLAKKGEYDIVMPSSNWAKLQINAKLVQKIDKFKLPNLKNLDPRILAQLRSADPYNSYLVNWLWGYTTVGVNVDKVTKVLGKTRVPDNLWALVFNPVYTAKLKSCGISFLDTPTDVWPAALHFLGKNPYSNIASDYYEAYELVKKVRPDIAAFNSAGQIDSFAKGNTCISIGWAGDFSQANKRANAILGDQNIVPVVPSTGAFMFMDSMAIPVNAKHVENAHLFIDYILRPKVHASLTNAVNYANPNLASIPFVDEDIQHNPGVFLNSSDMKRLIPVKSIDDATRKLAEELFLKLKLNQ